MMSRRDSDSGRFGGFRVFVGDIGHRVGRSDLEKEFGQYGPVTDVWMARRRDQGMQGFAFVVFRYPEDADEAVRDKNGRTLYGRQVRVEHAKPVDSSNSTRRDSGPGRGSYGGGPRGYMGDYGPPRGGAAPQHGRSRSRSRERYRRSPSPEYMRNTNRRPPSPPMERRYDSYNEPLPRKQLRINPSQSPEMQSRDRKNSRRIPRSPPPPPPKKSSNHQQDSEDQSTSSNSDSSSPSPPPKKKKKKRKKHRRARSTSNSSSGYNAEDYKVSQSNKHSGGKKLKASKRKEKNVAKNDSYSSSDS